MCVRRNSSRVCLCECCVHVRRTCLSVSLIFLLVVSTLFIFLVLHHGSLVHAFLLTINFINSKHILGPLC